MTDFTLPEMGIEETQERLLQSLDIIAQLTENNTADARKMALAFLSDFKPKDLSYDGSFLTGKSEDLNF